MAADTCAARGCSEEVCVLGSHEGKAHAFCLVHYYGSAFAARDASGVNEGQDQQQALASQARVLSTRALKRQRRTAEDLVREMLAEIGHDMEDELQRIKDQRDRREKVTSGALHKELVKEAHGAAMKQNTTQQTANAAPRRDAGVSKVGTVDVDKLYEWQLKMLHRKQTGRKLSDPEPGSQAASAAGTRKAQSSAPRATAANASATRSRVWKPTGEELLGQAHVPMEAWRRNAAELVANALLQDVDTARFDAGKAALDIENALFMHLHQNQNAYRPKMRTLLHNLRIAANEPLRRNIITGTLSAADLVKMDEAALMDPESRAKLERTQAEVFEQHRVVSTEEALASKSIVDDAQCPHCENSQGIIKLSLASSRPESTKAEIYGNKEKVDSSYTRFRCPACGYSWQEAN
ncbi:Transcription elongation factor A protein 3 [Hondaea fermentalgiana]|uniref:Transcription elongation factor A protein 3 n=1 Tax=Hondaea fermentalgiana TaxID=2315210 RepID=A0A2R5GQY9_9STRA|nr:Transcription elongation factor A protein 3 [Hondaea fermentalgiana]|eukprot:GBG33297.1 Transcription elongation factor A protein 3 [Hondaea fermentalgiana]